MDVSNNSSVINKILDMDLNDNVAIKSVIDIITSHPFRSAFFLGSLLGTSVHHNIELEKAIFFHHEAFTPDDYYSYIFKKTGNLGFLVNITEARHTPRHGIPFEHYGVKCDVEDIPLPPVHYYGIEELVRINVSSDQMFTIRKITVSENRVAHGRFFSVPTIDVTNIIASLQRREEGYKFIDELTTYYPEDNTEDDPNYNYELSDTFENKILNYIIGLQRNIKSTGELKTVAEGMFLGAYVYCPYDGQDILAVQSPIDDTVFMIAFNRVCTESIQDAQCALESNMSNLLTHFIPSYTFDAKQRNVILLAITYIVDPEPDFDTIDNIVSLRHSPEAEEFKYILKSCLPTVSLMDRCRYVILKNKHLMTNRIRNLPSFLQSFVWSSKLIHYRMKTIDNT